jgi:hypothetical protein
MISKLKTRARESKEKVSEKVPILGKGIDIFGDLWSQTFPDDQGKVRSKMQKRQEIALKMKSYTEEELAEMQEQIPEWKRGQMVMVDEEAKEEVRKGILKRSLGKITEKFTKTEVGKEFMESEHYKNI